MPQVTQPGLRGLTGQQCSHLRLWSRLALLSAVAIAFAPGLTNGFVWDDYPNLVENTNFRGLGFEQIRWAFTTFWQGPYQPLSWLSYAVDWQLWGMSPTGFHITNLALHLVNVVLFASVCEKLIMAFAAERFSQRAAVFGSIAAAGLFGLHPLRVESVTWATERRDVLSGVFFLGSILAYLNVYPRRSNCLKLDLKWYTVSFALFGLSLLSKATGVALPAVLILLDLGLRTDRPWWKSLLNKIPFFVLSLVIGLVALAGQRSAGAMQGMDHSTVTDRLAQLMYSIMFYVRAATVEWSWSPMYERPMPFDPFQARFIWSALGVVGVTVLIAAFRRVRVPLMLAWLSYILLLLPVSGVFQSGLQLVADRYSYLPLMPLYLLAGAALAGVAARSVWHMRLGAGMIIGCLVTCGILTARQTQVWQNDETLWNAALRNGPSAMAHNNLGALAQARGDHEAAMREFARSLQVIPKYGRARTNLVQAIVSWDDVSPESLDLAEQTLRMTMQESPDCVDCWYALGLANQRLGRPDLAVRDFQKSAELFPTSGKLLTALAKALSDTHDIESARNAHQRATVVAPRSIAAWIALAEFEASQNNPDAAQDALTSAAALDPADQRLKDLREKLRNLKSPASLPATRREGI